MAKAKKSEPRWAAMTRQLARDMKLSKKALKKAVDDMTVRLVAERIARQRVKDSLRRMPAPQRSGRQRQKKRKTTKSAR